jgi:membrane protease YdiL (CAAX protease family)
VLAGVLIAGVIACLFCAYSSLENLFGPTNGGNVDQRALGNALIVNTILFALLAAPLLRNVDIRATLIGTWSLRKSVLAGIGCAVLGRIVLYLGTLLVHAGRPAPAIENLVGDGLQGIHTAYGAWAVLLLAAVAVPILEELAFRGVILTALRRYISFWPAALAQAVAFATMHQEASLYLFFTGFGLAAALLARRSQGLLASIAMHATNNLLAVMPLLS